VLHGDDCRIAVTIIKGGKLNATQRTVLAHRVARNLCIINVIGDVAIFGDRRNERHHQKQQRKNCPYVCIANVHCTSIFHAAKVNIFLIDGRKK